MSAGKIPVAEAKRVAKAHELKQCLLIGWDGEQVHVVTYGTTPADCEAAAKAQDFWQGKIREFSFRSCEEHIATLTAERDTALQERDAARAALAGAETMIWKPRDEVPPAGRLIWVSDGKEVWLLRSDGKPFDRRATACKWWCVADFPLLPDGAFPETVDNYEREALTPQQQTVTG